MLPIDGQMDPNDPNADPNDPNAQQYAEYAPGIEPQYQPDGTIDPQQADADQLLAMHQASTQPVRPPTHDGPLLMSLPSSHFNPPHPCPSVPQQRAHFMSAVPAPSPLPRRFPAFAPTASIPCGALPGHAIA